MIPILWKDFRFLSIFCQWFLCIYIIKSWFLQLEIDNINLSNLTELILITTIAIIKVLFFVDSNLILNISKLFSI